MQPWGQLIRRDAELAVVQAPPIGTRGRPTYVRRLFVEALADAGWGAEAEAYPDAVGRAFRDSRPARLGPRRHQETGSAAASRVRRITRIPWSTIAAMGPARPCGWTSVIRLA
ncbi:hypothetical protein ACNPQM_04210 [Streptomyces sp. NPDC056231]|uniref:hypothetical protein n=1 Tax=Streptomyces sp. NPDC056231 TaxID=3345755 RepID=UPI003AAB1B19